MAMSGERFSRTVVAGLIATFVMTMTGFWQSGVGLPTMDVAAMLAGNMMPDAPYTLAAGNVAHFGIGVLVALIWVALLQARIPGNWIVQGLVYGVLVTVVAAAVVFPLAAGVGIFFSNTPAPGRMLLGATVPHLTYGLSLTLSLRLAGVEA